MPDGGDPTPGPPVQPPLFDDGTPPTPPEDAGYRQQTACSVAGITYRQLDYWARTGLVAPSIRRASGSGTQRLYSFRDIVVLKIVRDLLETGVSLHNVRAAVEHLRTSGVTDLTGVTLISDGHRVYECSSADEVFDLIQGGQGVFGIAIGRAAREVEGSLAKLPVERPDEPGAKERPGEAAKDELSARRQRRAPA